ncbi:antitoxin [Thiofilum flexile]|uniref:antitoxin n=1 Tax=Thiofilum flexile TaxID=125627 RepID=UPI00036E7F45|nr:type II toxin-antitoxin system VapB family antitoxin [Thiofilum flexile]
MLITRVFQSGNSQAVRIPKEFQFEESEVEIFRRGDEIILRRRVDTLGDVLDIFAAFPDDFMAEGRQDVPPQERNFEQ